MNHRDESDTPKSAPTSAASHHHDHAPSHVHSHGLDPEHSHEPMPESVALLDRLTTLLVGKGLVTQDELIAQQRVTDNATHENGARMVAKAWCDPDYRRLLLSDGSTAAEALGYSMAGAPPLGVVENTDTVHHLIVCTLCSCYPRQLLGYPPEWYKSSAYRARAVRDPRTVLAEWGLPIPTNTEVRVIDSTADFRWMVLPRRPAGTDHLDEAALARLVTRDALIGADVLRMPTDVPFSRSR
jgi:nitrile hydratase